MSREDLTGLSVSSSRQGLVAMLRSLLSHLWRLQLRCSRGGSLRKSSESVLQVWDVIHNIIGATRPVHLIMAVAY